MEEIPISLDIDKWGYGRDPHGRLNGAYLKAAGYPHVERPPFNGSPADAAKKCRQILWENIEPERDGTITWVFIDDCFFFLHKEDAEVFRALLYIY